MPEHLVGFQITQAQQKQPPQQIQQTPQRMRGATTSSSIGEFIVDDLKLFVSPVTAVVDELLRQLKR